MENEYDCSTSPFDMSRKIESLYCHILFYILILSSMSFYLFVYLFDKNVDMHEQTSLLLSFISESLLQKKRTIAYVVFTRN